MPQAPQFCLSVLVLTHSAPQFVSSAGHCAAHAELTQTCPAAQAFAQLPQWAASLLVSTH